MHKCKGLGARITISIMKPMLSSNQNTVVYTRIYGNMNHVDLRSQGSGNLGKCGGQSDRNITRILLFLDDDFDVLSGLWCEICSLTYVLHLSLGVFIHLLGTAPLKG